MTGKLIHKDVGSVLTEVEYDATDAHELASQAVGDLVYADAATGGLDGLAIGSTDQVLVVASGKPAWSDNIDVPGTLDVTGAATLDSTLSVATSISLGDSVPINLGASNDAVIQHTGTDLEITVTTGQLHISGNVGIGTADPDGTLHVLTSSAGGVIAGAGADDLVVESSGTTGITIFSGNANGGGLFFGDANDNDAGRVTYDHSLGDMSFWVEGSEIGQWRSTGLLIGTAATLLIAAESIAQDLIIASGDDAGISIQGTTSGNIHFGDAGDADIGKIAYSHSGNSLSFWTNATQALDIDSSGNMNLRGGTLTVNNTSSLEGTVHAFSASAGLVDAHTSADEIVAENSGDGGISILTPNTATGALYFADPDDNDRGGITYSHSNDTMVFRVGGASAARLLETRLELFDFTGNTFQTQGLNIHQGTNDDEILTLQSGDVGHGITDDFEAVTFGTFKKVAGATGGLSIEGISDNSQVTAMIINGTSGGSLDTAHSNSGRSTVEVHTYVKSAATRAGIATANANLWGVRNGNSSTVAIIDVEGDLHLDGVVATAFDHYDDLNLVRAFDRATADKASIIENEWDQYVQYNEQSLVDAGILGAPRSEGGLINVTKLQRLHNGTLWQLGSLVKTLTARLETAENKLKALEA